MYNNILIPVTLDNDNGLQASIGAAQALADNGARLTLLHVRESIPGFAAAQIPAEILKKARDEAEEMLHQMAATLPGAAAVIASGHAGTSIVDYARENAVDCIVMASHKPGLENLLLGSTADRVVRHAQCSVHVIR